MFLIPPPGLMRPKAAPPLALIGVSDNSLGDGNSSIQPGLPSHQAGDFMLCLYGGGAISAASPISTPAGYTVLQGVTSNLAGDGSCYLYAWGRIAGGSEVNPSISLSGGVGFKGAALMSFRNHGFAVPGDMVRTGGLAGNFVSTFPTASASMLGDTADGNIRVMAWYCNRQSTSQLLASLSLSGTGETQQVLRVGGSAGENAFGDRALIIYTGVRPAIGTGTLTLSGFQSASTGALGFEGTVEA